MKEEENSEEQITL